MWSFEVLIMVSKFLERQLEIALGGLRNSDASGQGVRKCQGVPSSRLHGGNYS